MSLCRGPQSILVTKATKKEVFLSGPCGLIHWLPSLPPHYCFPSELANYAQRNHQTVLSLHLPRLFLQPSPHTGCFQRGKLSVSSRSSYTRLVELKSGKTWLCWTKEQKSLGTIFIQFGRTGGGCRGTKTALISAGGNQRQTKEMVAISTERGFTSTSVWSSREISFSTEVPAAGAANSPTPLETQCVSRHQCSQNSWTEEQRVNPYPPASPPKWPEKRRWLHFTQVQYIQRKTAKSRGSPFLRRLEFPSCLWKWIKFMPSMKPSKSSSCRLPKETLFLFLLQLSSARTAFIRRTLHMHFLSTKKKKTLGENQDTTFSNILTIYTEHRK